MMSKTTKRSLGAREYVTETLMDALDAARRGMLLGPDSGFKNGRTEGGQLVAHGATITALVKRKAIVQWAVSKAYTLTPYGVTVLARRFWK